jgi:hypothetical protein
MFSLLNGVTSNNSTEDFRNTIGLSGKQCHPPKVVKKVVFLKRDQISEWWVWGKWVMEGRISQNPNGFGTDNRLLTIFYIQLAVDSGQVSFDGLG